VLIALVVPAAAVAAPAVPGRTVDLQILNISDWHGQVVPNGTNPATGGAAYLKPYFDSARAEVPNTLTLTAGDDVGATPPISNYFDDVPAILAERMMGIQVGTFGNHNFDYGLERLQDQIDLAGSTDPADPGTPFRYVVANLSNRDANISGVRDYAIFSYKGVKVAVIGTINEEAPTLNFPGSFGTMEPTAAAAAAMRAQAAARAEGANVFIALTHKGIENIDNGVASGPLVDFAEAVSGFAVIFGDHTDIRYSGTVNGQLVVENRSKGVTFSKTLLTVQRGTGQVVNTTHAFVDPITTGVTPDQAILDMLAPYQAELAPIFLADVAESGVAIPRADSCGTGNGRTCESKIGNLITDAIRDTYDTDFAIMNSGGIRADLTCPATDNPNDFCPAYASPPPPYTITRGKVNEVLPFGNISTVIDMTGPQLKSWLEHGVSRMPALDGRFAQVSGLCLTYNIEATPGSRLTGVVRQAADGSCTGAAVDLTAGSFTVGTNEFVAAGGDAYPVIPGGVTFDILDQDVTDWLTAAGTVEPVLQGRITCTDPNPGIGNNCPVLTNP
jgi:2',3'-cyclic-nucleotide 2'-phosphodiesterase (5'-nucleotidase family)